MKSLNAWLPRILVRRQRLVGAAVATAAMATAMLALRPAPPETMPVLVAARDLRAGPLGPHDVSTVELPRGAVPAGALRAEATVTGRMLAAPMRRGEPLTDARFIGRALLDGYGVGLVATPVRIADPDAARFLTAGNRVDVLAAPMDPQAHDAVDGLGQDPAAEDKSQESPPVSSPIGSVATRVVRDVAVVSVLAPAKSPWIADERGALVLLATTSEQASALAGAQATARLSIAIRSPP